MLNKIKSEEPPTYLVKHGDDIINQAIDILYSRMTVPDFFATSPSDTRKYVMLKLAELEHEVFGVLFLSNRHGLIKYEEMFRGTIDSAVIYPREVIKRALQLNAAALILVHNHPSGDPEPSSADYTITRKIKDAANLLDIRVLDHLVVGRDEVISLAESGAI